MPLYQGSRILQPLAMRMNLPLDQVNFMVGEVLALLLSFVYRIYLRPSAVGATIRHIIAASVGLTLGVFCYGLGFLHMLVQAAGCYLIMWLAPAKIMHKLVFFVAMLYMCLMHIYRMTYDYGGYALDVTGPLMISTQKLTALAFSLHDGLYKAKEKLSPDQTQQAVRKFPNPLIFCSYIFYFQGLLAGPMCFFSDYISFVEGTNYDVPHPSENMNSHDDINLNQVSNSSTAQLNLTEPNPMMIVIYKLVVAAVCLGVALGISPIYALDKNWDENFVNSHGFWYRIWFMYLSITFARARYYFAWKFGEAVNNASGLGFSGYDQGGHAKWDLVTNVNIRKLETATSLKVLVDNWNVQTAIWLRRICYDRAPSLRMAATYTLSAIWHGFYPGYYFTFIGAVFFTTAARGVRKVVRPHFQVSRGLQIFYDILTWASAQLVLAYLIVPFNILAFWPTIYFYHRSVYWVLHWIVIIILITLQFVRPPRSVAKQQKTE